MSSPSTTTDKLKAALEAERADSDVRLQRYKLLTAKIADYQVGTGPAPTEEEFSQWLADVKHAVDLKNMLGGG
jgi:hypothetical protein